MINFSVRREIRNKMFLEFQPKSIPIFKQIRMDVPYLDVTCNDFEGLSDVGRIFDKLYDDIVELSLLNEKIGILFDLNGVVFEIVIDDSDFLDDIVKSVEKRYIDRCTAMGIKVRR